MAVLTLRGSSVADTTLTNACDMSLNTTGGTEVGKLTTISATSLTYAEITSQGKTVTGVSAIPSTPTGNGWVYQPGAGTFANATWQATLTLALTLLGAPNNVTFRIFKLPGGVLASAVSIGTMSITVTTTAKTVYTTSATTMPATTFGSTDLLYFDVWWHDSSSNVGGDNPTVYESTSATTGVANDFVVSTANFTTGIALSATMAGVGTLGTTITTPSLGVLLAGQGTLSATLTIPVLPYTVNIGGTNVFVVAGTLSGSNGIGRRSAASFQVLTDAGIPYGAGSYGAGPYSGLSTHFQQYQQVQIYDTHQLLAFSGYVGDPNGEYQPGWQAKLVHDIACMDQHYCADKRIIAVLYRNKTCGFMVQDIVTNILAAEGVTVGSIAVGATVPIANFGYCTVATALDALVAYASASGTPHYWQIDRFKKLWFLPYTALPGPAIDGTQIDPGNLSGVVPTVNRANPAYRNTQYAVGGVTQTGTNDETVQGDGQTRAFPFKYQLSQAPTTFTLNGVSKTLGTKGQTGFQYYWAQGDNIIAQDSSQTILVSTDRLRMIYIGQYAAVFTNNLPTQITAQAALDGTSGINEEVLTDNTIATAADGLAKVNQQLTQYGMAGSRFVFATRQAGLAAGQLCAVTYAPYGFSATQMLLEDVTFSDQADSFNIWYTVSAVVGPYDTTWVEFFGNLLAKPQTLANSINLGIAVNTPLYPSTTLHPSTTLFPS